MLRTAILAIIFVIGWQADCVAQSYYCPPGSRPVRGGGGTMCLCRDGSYADIDGCRARYQPPPQPRCTSGYYEQDGKCIKAGRSLCPDGEWTCPDGKTCSRYSNRCISVGYVECEGGTHLCPNSMKCNRKNDGCIPADHFECYFTGKVCRKGLACAAEPNAGINGSGCVPRGEDLGDIRGDHCFVGFNDERKADIECYSNYIPPKTIEKVPVPESYSGLDAARGMLYDPTNTDEYFNDMIEASDRRVRKLLGHEQQALSEEQKKMFRENAVRLSPSSGSGQTPLPDVKNEAPAMPRAPYTGFLPP